ncbi:MAG: RNA 2',3'-cyclic phosphodiesterase [Acidobacteria bacterium]|nr:RNA 2',3'-cyclic phosphodiesterase [Acidobacteriota bacterium]
MARLFTAIELTGATRDAVAAEQRRLTGALRSSGGRDLRMVRAPQLHLTLVFLGEVAEDRVPTITEAMGRDLPCEPFSLSFAGAGVFPPRGPARVLWLGVAEGAAQVVRLFDLVSDRLAAVGVPRETRVFAPHLTIGRWRERGPSRLSLPEVGTIATEPVSVVTLFHSRLLAAGPEHTAIAHARLAGGGRGVHYTEASA